MYPYSLILEHMEEVLFSYEGCLTNAAFITVVGYNSNNSIDNELMPMRFGQELFGENGKNFMAILIAISTFGCVIPPEDGSFDYRISYRISWVAVALGLIFWFIRNQWQRRITNRELIQNQTD
ncbi:8165_t:CDS:2 [Gigaspora margarita]|uniref:8165_t:CDS:1 n=1 Tax=Gigaspora margarita TaxID=4874 RepID=A0ABN7UWZ4_GIGMA|nr:8165_t:CDS:2 [Gigaspora margarita]